MVVGGIGAKMLAKMGWSEGTGLGAKRDGTLTPISVKKRPENLGVGAERRPFQDAWWEKMMDDAYGKSDTTTDATTLFDACEGRRCRPHGSAKLARLEVQEKSVSDDQKISESNLGLPTLKRRKKDSKKKASKREKQPSIQDGEQNGRIRKKKRKAKKARDAGKT